MAWVREVLALEHCNKGRRSCENILLIRMTWRERTRKNFAGAYPTCLQVLACSYKSPTGVFETKAGFIIMTFPSKSHEKRRGQRVKCCASQRRHTSCIPEVVFAFLLRQVQWTIIIGTMVYTCTDKHPNKRISDACVQRCE